MVLKAADLVTALQKGGFGDDLPPERIFGYQQVKTRRLYPSIEIVSTGESIEKDQSRDKGSYKFEVRIYVKKKGQEDDEISDLEAYESEVMDLLSDVVLADHRITLESFNWKRESYQTTHPFYTVSTLTVLVNRVSLPTLPSDGTLIFNNSGSSVEPLPGSDYTYFSVFNTEISEGYEKIKEYTTNNIQQGIGIPVDFTGGFDSSFITHFNISKDDLGSTGDKLNEIFQLGANGETGDAKFTFKNKDNLKIPNDITESLTIAVDKIVRLYKVGENTVFRLIGTVTKPGVIT